MNIKQILTDSFQEVIRFVAAALFYLAAPLRAPWSWPTRAQDEHTPPKTDSFSETRLFYFLSLALLIFVTAEWYADYIVPSWANIVMGEAERAADETQIAKQLVAGSFDDPRILGCLLGAFFGTAALEAWFRTTDGASLRKSNTGLLTIAFALSNIYFLVLSWLIIRATIWLAAKVYDGQSLPWLAWIQPLTVVVVLSAFFFAPLTWLVLSVYRTGAGADIKRAVIGRAAVCAQVTAFVIGLGGIAIGMTVPDLLREPEVVLTAVDFSRSADKTSDNGDRDCRMLVAINNRSGEPILIHQGQPIYVSVKLAQFADLQMYALATIETLVQSQATETLIGPGTYSLIKSGPLRWNTRGVTVPGRAVFRDIKVSARLMTSSGNISTSQSFSVDRATFNECLRRPLQDLVKTQRSDQKS